VANAVTSSMPADNSGRRDQEAVTEDRAAANLAGVTGRLDTDTPHMKRPPRTGRLVPVTGHSQGRLAVPPNRTHQAHTGDMGRIIGTILGAIFAIWLAVTFAGGIAATLKTFLIIGLVAMAVFIVVRLVARRPPGS